MPQLSPASEVKEDENCLLHASCCLDFIIVFFITSTLLHTVSQMKNLNNERKEENTLTNFPLLPF